jgi:hypothetical protein
MTKKKRPSAGGDHWTVNDVRSILHNPIYVGLGPYPALIDVATWIGAQERLVEADGAGPVLVQIRRLLEETIGYAPDWMTQSGWLEGASAQVEREGARVFFPRLLDALRDAYQQA